MYTQEGWNISSQKGYKMIEFYISQDTEKQKLMDVFCVEPIGASLDYRAKQYHFPLEMAQKMQSLPRIQWDTELEDLLEKTYTQNQEELIQSLAYFQCFWNKNGTL